MRFTSPAQLKGIHVHFVPLMEEHHEPLVSAVHRMNYGHFGTPRILHLTPCGKK